MGSSSIACCMAAGMTHWKPKKLFKVGDVISYIEKIISFYGAHFSVVCLINMSALSRQVPAHIR